MERALSVLNEYPSGGSVAHYARYHPYSHHVVLVSEGYPCVFAKFLE